MENREPGKVPVRPRCSSPAMSRRFSDGTFRSHKSCDEKDDEEEQARGPAGGNHMAVSPQPLVSRALAYVAFKELSTQMRPCANPWCTKFSHRKGKLCAACEEITSGIFVENMLIHLSWSPSTWRLRVSLSAAELMWSPAGKWEMDALPGSPFPTVVKAVSVSTFALGGRLICRLPPGSYSVAWRLSRAPTEAELEEANRAHSVWGLKYTVQDCFDWIDPEVQACMRYTTNDKKSPKVVQGLIITEDTVQMLPAWTELAIGMVELNNPCAEDELCKLVLETELHCCSLRAQGGLYIDGVVLRQTKETDCRKLFNNAPRVIRETKPQ